MRTLIPGHLIAVLSEVCSECETHASLDSLFMYAGAPGDPPGGSKPVKAQEWLRLVNKSTSVDPLDVLGRLIEAYMEADCDGTDTWSVSRAERKAKLEKALARAQFQYVRGGRVTGLVASPSHTLSELIRKRDLVSVNEEFARALSNVEAEPREAVSAACNILEAVCKTYIEDEGLELPAKPDLQAVWHPVRKHLGFDPSAVADNDLKVILTGLLSIVSGIGALRTHASSAHASGRKRYQLEPRHARLAVHAAHTTVLFILESWDKRRRSATIGAADEG